MHADRFPERRGRNSLRHAACTQPDLKGLGGSGRNSPRHAACTQPDLKGLGEVTVTAGR